MQAVAVLQRVFQNIQGMQYAVSIIQGVTVVTEKELRWKFLFTLSAFEKCS